MFNQDNKLKDLQAEMNRLNEQAAGMVRDNAWMNEQAAAMGEAVYYGFENNNLVDLMTETVRVGKNETVSIAHDIRGLSAFHVARGGYIEESSLHAETDYIRKDQIGIHFVEHLDRLETNFATSAQTLIQLAPQRIDAEINKRVLATAQAAVPSSSPYYTATANLTLTQLSAAIAAVEDVIEPTAGAPVIVARPQMIRKIRDALTAQNNYSMFLPETNEDLLRRGQLYTYQGTPILTLKNYTDEFGRSYFPNNELWVVGKDAGKTAFFGTPRVQQWTDPTVDYWHWSLRTDYGVSIYRPSHLRRIVDSSVAA